MLRLENLLPLQQVKRVCFFCKHIYSLLLNINKAIGIIINRLPCCQQQTILIYTLIFNESLTRFFAEA